MVVLMNKTELKINESVYEILVILADASREGLDKLCTHIVV